MESTMRLTKLHDPACIQAFCIDADPAFGEETDSASSQPEVNRQRDVTIIDGKALLTTNQSVGGLVVEYVPATDETRVRFPADATISFLFSSFREEVHHRPRHTCGGVVITCRRASLGIIDIQLVSSLRLGSLIRTALIAVSKTALGVPSNLNVLQ